jgi:hypothetical protein
VILFDREKKGHSEHLGIPDMKESSEQGIVVETQRNWMQKST